MADYLLLQKPCCPRCRCALVAHFRQCPNCGTMLFLRPIQFARYEADGGFVNWWLYDKAKGWMHRDAIMIPEFKPNEREYKAPKLPDDYGRSVTPEQVQQRGGRIRLKGKIRKKPRRFF